MSTWMLLFLTTLFALCSSAFSANILAILPTVSRSHYIWTRILPLELVSRGHHVTVVAPEWMKENISNLTEIYLEGSYENLSYDFDYEEMVDQNIFSMATELFVWTESICEYQLNTNGAKQLMKLSETEKFDLIIMETLCNECFYPFISKFGSPPVIGLSGFELPIWISYMFGNPEPFAYVPNGMLPFSEKMSFKERLTNTVYNIWFMLYRNYIVMPKFQKIAEKHLGHPVQPLLEMEKQFSLLFANLIIGVDSPRPLVPNIIPVGGIHIKKPKPLSKDLQEYLDNAKHGVIFFSLGSNLRSDQLTEEARKAILGALSELPQKILWKWESDSLPGKPDNVKISKWLPQTDILAHPNVKLFISHCGLMSTQETMHRGVPVVGIPIFADQHTNLLKMKALGMAEGVEFRTISKESFLGTIQKVLYTPSYTENVKRISSVFRDQPETPLDRAVFWTEYVLRHKGAPHLRSAALDLEWYQYFLLDVSAVVLLGALVTLWIFYVVTKTIFRMVFGKNKVKKD